MFNIGYFKGQPTEHIIHYASGRVVRQGAGLAFYYLKFNTQIVAVPTSSLEANFVFNEITNNFQPVTLQGQFAYRIRAPQQAAAVLNFTIDPNRRVYVSKDPELLSQRITSVIQTDARGEIQKRTLQETLGESQVIAANVLTHIRDNALLDALGVELITLHFLSVKPTPEMAKALEAEYREALLRKADEAIYARRASAVEEERKIKEKELNTQITLEQQREALINLQGENARREAESRGKALELEAEYKARATEREAQARGKAVEMELGIYRTLEPRTVLGLALRDLGQSAAKAGALTITSEFLASLVNALQTAQEQKENNSHSE